MRSAMRAASRLPDSGSTDVNDARLHLHINHNSNYDMFLRLCSTSE